MFVMSCLSLALAFARVSASTFGHAVPVLVVARTLAALKAVVAVEAAFVVVVFFTGAPAYWLHTIRTVVA